MAIHLIAVTKCINSFNVFLVIASGEEYRPTEWCIAMFQMTKYGNLSGKRNALKGQSAVLSRGPNGELWKKW